MSCWHFQWVCVFMCVSVGGPSLRTSSLCKKACLNTVRDKRHSGDLHAAEVQPEEVHFSAGRNKIKHGGSLSGRLHGSCLFNPSLIKFPICFWDDIRFHSNWPSLKMCSKQQAAAKVSEAGAAEEIRVLLLWWIYLNLEAFIQTNNIQIQATTQKVFFFFCISPRWLSSW